MALNQWVNRFAILGMYAAAGLLAANQLVNLHSEVFSETFTYESPREGKKYAENKIQSRSAEGALFSVMTQKNRQGLRFTEHGWFLNTNQNPWHMDMEGQLSGRDISAGIGVKKTAYRYGVSLHSSSQRFGVSTAQPDAIDHNFYTYDKFVF